MPDIVSIAPRGFFFAEQMPGLTFSRVVWHAAGHEVTTHQFINGYYIAQAIAATRNLRLSRG